MSSRASGHALGDKAKKANKRRDKVLLAWDEIPDFMRTSEVRPYWEVLNKKRAQLVLKRAFDVALSVVMIVVLLIPMLVIGVAVKLASPGPMLYRQIRITQYGRKFKICKFRTMYDEASRKENGVQVESAVTVSNDSRVTKVGRVLRKYRLDEFPQLFNVLAGDMSFVGTRPEVVKFVEKYQPEFYATLLMPAGITSECSIRFKDEDRLLDGAENVAAAYIEKVLPAKMEWNLASTMMFSCFRDLVTIIRTVLAIFGKDYV